MAMDKSKFYVGKGDNKKMYDLNEIEGFDANDRNWLHDMVEEHPWVKDQTLLLTKKEALSLHAIRSAEKKMGKPKPGGGFYMMLCILTVTKGEDGKLMRKPQPGNRGPPNDPVPGFTSWENMMEISSKLISFD